MLELASFPAVDVVTRPSPWAAWRWPLSRLWAKRPPLPDYFRDLLMQNSCTYPEMLVRMF